MSKKYNKSETDGNDSVLLSAAKPNLTVDDQLKKLVLKGLNNIIQPFIISSCKGNISLLENNLNIKVTTSLNLSCDPLVANLM
jgi:tRNA(Phe) wybutosine-synthesizing methylase Tyw3